MYITFRPALETVPAFCYFVRMYTPLFTFDRGGLWYEMWSFPGYWWQLIEQHSIRIKAPKIHYGPHNRQYYLDVAPLAAPNGHTVLYFHGGGWQFGRPEQFLLHAEVLASAGYRVWMASHRKIPLHNAADIREDISLMLDRFRREGEGKLIVMGMSSGGNLAALIGLDPKLHRDCKPVAMVLLAAPLNLKAIAPNPTVLSFAGSPSGKLFAQADPYSLLPGHPSLPALIIHGEKDGLIPAPGIEAFAGRLRETQSDRVELDILPQATHMDIASWPLPGNPLRERILSWLAADKLT